MKCSGWPQAIADHAEHLWVSQYAEWSDSQAVAVHAQQYVGNRRAHRPDSQAMEGLAQQRSDDVVVDGRRSKAGPERQVALQAIGGTSRDGGGTAGSKAVLFREAGGPELSKERG